MKESRVTMQCDDSDGPTPNQYEAVRVKLERYASKLIMRYREIFLTLHVEAADLVSEAILKIIHNNKDGCRDISERLPYLYRTIYTIAMDYIRKTLRVRNHIESVPDWKQLHRHDQIDRTDCSRNHLLLRFKQIQQVLHRIENKLNAGQIDYYAVFILQFRLRILHQILKAWHVLEFQVDETDPMDLAQRIFQWTSTDESRSIKTGYPDLRSIWEEMRRSPLRLSRGPIEIFLSALATISGERFQLSPMQWYTQVKRAKSIIRECMGEPDWHRHFGYFFPDKHPHDLPAGKEAHHD